MNIFTQDDIDFSSDFYKYMNTSYDKQLQEKILRDKNNKIIKNNIAKLESCIKENLNNDNTLPFDKTFVCSGFKKLYKNNNNDFNNNINDNMQQYVIPMSKINMTNYPLTSLEKDSVEYVPPEYHSRDYRGFYKFNSNIIPKNSYTYLSFDRNYLLVRISNLNENNNNSIYQTYPIYSSNEE
jgi:hypothetical protein